jgi:hypothetical protein
MSNNPEDFKIFKGELKKQWDNIDKNKSFQFCDILMKESTVDITEINKQNFQKFLDYIDTNNLLVLTKNVRYRHMMQPFWRMKLMKFYELGPVDLCIYNALSLHLYEKIKKFEVETIKYKSFGYDDYNSFKNEINQRLTSKEENDKYIFRFDITDFYSSICQHRLEEILKKNIGENDVYVKALNNMLSQLSKNQSYAIPIGPEGSKYLAEIFLFEIDNSILSFLKRENVRNYQFYRHSDDFVLFLDNRQIGNNIYQEISRLLIQNYNLTIQESKTKLEKISYYKESIYSKNHLKNDFINLLKYNNNARLNKITIITMKEKLDRHDINDIFYELKNEIEKDIEMKRRSFPIEQKVRCIFQIIQGNELNLTKDMLELIKSILKDHRSINMDGFLQELLNDRYKDFLYNEVLTLSLNVEYNKQIDVRNLKLPLKNTHIKEFLEPLYSYRELNSDTLDPLTFFDARYDYDNWNLWQQIAYLNLIQKNNIMRRTSFNEFEKSKFIKTINKNLVPFYFGTIEKLKILENGDVVLNPTNETKQSNKIVQQQNGSIKSKPSIDPETNNSEPDSLGLSDLYGNS